jgi:UrcA family protein
MAFKFEIDAADRLLLSCLGVSAALVVALVAISGVARSAEPSSFDASSSVHVGYGDLNLASSAGAQAMLSRIRSAANEVCGGQLDRRVIGEPAAFERCRADTVNRTVGRLDAPMVTALNDRIGRQIALASR